MPLGLPDLSKFEQRFDNTEALQKEMLAELRITNRLLASLVTLGLREKGVETTTEKVLDNARNP